MVPPEPDDSWRLAGQMGVEEAVIHPIEVGDGRTRWSYDDVQQLSNWLDNVGLNFNVLEGSVPISDRIRLGRDGRDQDIAVFKQSPRDCGEVGIPVVCSDWTAGVMCARPAAHIEARGGSYRTGFAVTHHGGGTETLSAATHEDL